MNGEESLGNLHAQNVEKISQNKIKCFFHIAVSSCCKIWGKLRRIIMKGFTP